MQRRDAHLLEIIDTPNPVGCFARGLDGGQEQTGNDSKDGDDNKEFDKRERFSVPDWSGPVGQRGDCHRLALQRTTGLQGTEMPSARLRKRRFLG
jgi:hypothetical protein